MHRADIDRQSFETEDVVIHKELKRTWRSYVWDTLDKSPEERRFLFKLDFALLTFASLGTRKGFLSLRIQIADILRIFHQVSRPIQYQ